MSFDHSITRLCAYVYASSPALFMLGFSAFLLWLDRRRRHREAAKLRERRKREEEQELRKIGERIMREMACEPSSVTPYGATPSPVEKALRKATGFFSGVEAQEMLAK